MYLAVFFTVFIYWISDRLLFMNDMRSSHLFWYLIIGAFYTYNVLYSVYGIFTYPFLAVIKIHPVIIYDHKEKLSKIHPVFSILDTFIALKLEVIFSSQIFIIYMKGNLENLHYEKFYISKIYYNLQKSKMLTSAGGILALLQDNPHVKVQIISF